MRRTLNYLIGIVILVAVGIFAYYAQATVSPKLGLFFGFTIGYAAAVLVFFYILGRRGS